MFILNHQQFCRANLLMCVQQKKHPRQVAPLQAAPTHLSHFSYIIFLVFLRFFGLVLAVRVLCISVSFHPFPVTFLSSFSQVQTGDRFPLFT
jgi:cytochrome b561